MEPLDPFSIESYFYLAIIPCVIGVILKKFGVGQPTRDWVEVVVFCVAALANFLVY